MFFFVGWPKVVPLKNSEVIDIQHNVSKIWSVVLTKDRISIWTFALNQNILLGFLKRSDIDKYGENRFVLWSYDSHKIAVITTKLCVYLYNIEEINEFVINHNNIDLPLNNNNQNNNTNTNNNNNDSLIPKVKKIRIIPYKLLHLMKLPPYSTITRACHLTNDIFVISTNHAQFIHIHWKGHVELTCQLNLKNKSTNNQQLQQQPQSQSNLNSNQNNNDKNNLKRNKSRSQSLTSLTSSIGIVDLAMSSKLGIMVVVFESGSCWIIPLQKLSKNVPIHSLSVNQTTYISEYENVTCCDICDRFHFLSLGLSTGNVVIYHMGLEFIQQAPNINQNDNNNNANNINKASKLQYRLELLTIFSAHNYNLIPQTFSLDDVREVSWCDSGTSLAISWKKGVVVYSVRGIVVFSTLHHQINNDNNNNNNNNQIKPNQNKQDPLTTYYPSCLKWLQKDSGFIMVTHKEDPAADDFSHYLKQYQIEKKLKQKQLQQQQHKDDINKDKKDNKDDDDDNDSSDEDDKNNAYQCLSSAYLIQIKCVKHSLGNLSQSDVSKLALLGSSYISIWRPVHIIDDPESTDYWSRIEIDSYYLSRNWPIRELSVNKRSDCVSIAGSTGFAIYYRKTAKWKVIRSLDGENILFTCCMSWLTNDLLLVSVFDPSFNINTSNDHSNNDNRKQSKWNLLCFDKNELDNHFNTSSGIPLSSGYIPIFQYPLTNHPIGMECVDNDKLLIYFVDGVIHIYDIDIKHPHSSHHHHHHHHHNHHHINDNIDDNNNVDINYPIIKLKNYCVLAPFQTLSPHPVSLRLWNYGYNNSGSNNNDKYIKGIDDPGFCILSLDASRCLYRINPINNNKELITENVHDFYLMRETRDKYDQCYLWTYSLNNVERWSIYYDKYDNYKLKLNKLYVSPVQSHMTCIGICNTLNVLVYGRRIIRQIQPLYAPRFAIHIDIRSYLHVTIKEKLSSIGLEATFDFVLKVIAGGAWRCLNALENILRSSLQKRYKIKQRKKKKKSKKHKNALNKLLLDASSDTNNDEQQLSSLSVLGDNNLPFDQDALLEKQSLRSTYVFYPKDVTRDYSAINLSPNKQILQSNNSSSASNNGNTQSSSSSSSPKINIKHVQSKVIDKDNDNNNNNVNNDVVPDLKSDDDDNNTIMMQSELLQLQQMNNNIHRDPFCGYSTDEFNKKIEEEEREIDIVIKFLHKFPDYPGIVVNVARKTEPSQWNDLFKLCGTPIVLIEKSIRRNQLAAASKYLYVFEKIAIEYAIHYSTLLIELSIQTDNINLVLSLLRFSHKLKLMIKESHSNNIEIPQLNITL